MKKGRGVFGGTAGLWLIRKKHHATTKVAITGQSVSERKDTETTIKRNCVLPSKNKNTASETVSITNNNLESWNETESWIDWDEVRSRPIYSTSSSLSRVTSATSTQQKERLVLLEDDDDDDIDDQNQTPLYASIKKSTHRVSTDTPEEQTSPLCSPNTVAAKIQGRQRFRSKGAVYGGRKRSAFVPVTESRDSLSADDEDLEMEENHPSKRISATIVGINSNNNNNQAENKQTCISANENENAVDKPTESQDGGSCKVEETAQSAPTSLNTSTNQQCEDTIFNFDTTKATWTTVDETVNNDAARISGRPHPRSQPRTSLDVARDFFAKIDADPTLLTLELQHDSPNPNTSRPVYTSRGQLPRKVALAEYQIYCAACREATVTPIPMPAFLQQRSQFFRPDEVFDGMFDD